MSDRFRDRADAGRRLAARLERYRDAPNLLVLALPRGGVPVGHEVALGLGAPLDVFLVRKLGVPRHEELAMGAVASGGVVVVNDDVVRALAVRPEVFQRVVDRQLEELQRRERQYRGARPQCGVAGRTVILVDDGLATGSSMRAAIKAVRSMEPAQIVVAVPVAPRSTCQAIAPEVDEVVCLTSPSPFLAVGLAYKDFTQVTDDQVRAMLNGGPEAV